MSQDLNLLNEINEKLTRIEKKLNIVPDLEITVTNYDDSIKSFQDFAKNNQKLEPITIKNYSQIILKFLNHSKGIINQNTVKLFFDSNNSDSSKSNHLKALRKYTRDFLKLGNWIEDFKFENNSKVKIKNIPDDSQLSKFYNLLPTEEIRLIFLILHNSGLRIGECLVCKRNGKAQYKPRTCLHHLFYDDTDPLAYTIEVCGKCHYKIDSNNKKLLDRRYGRR